MLESVIVVPVVGVAGVLISPPPRIVLTWYFVAAGTAGQDNVKDALPAAVEIAPTLMLGGPESVSRPLTEMAALAEVPAGLEALTARTASEDGIPAGNPVTKNVVPVVSPILEPPTKIS